MCKNSEKKVSGIYKITNMVNGKVYIGQSNNCYRRSYQHIRDLLGGKHVNEYLQKSFDKHGRSSFTNQIIERCPVDKLTERELFWMKHYESTNMDKGYNLNTFVDDRSTMTEETRQKLSQKAKDWLDKNKPSYVPCTEEEWLENRKKGLVWKKGQWVTFEEAYGRKENPIKIHERRVWSVNIETRGVLEHKSAAQCGRDLGIRDTLVFKCLNGFDKGAGHKVMWQVKGFRFFSSPIEAYEFAKSMVVKNPTPNNGRCKVSRIVLTKNGEEKVFSSYTEIGRFLGMDRGQAQYNIKTKKQVGGWEMISTTRVK